MFERHAADETFGFGVVFSQETLDNIIAADPPSFEAIAARFRTWSAIDMDVFGYRERSDGHTFAALERRVLLGILADRADELGADLRFRTDVSDPLALAADYDVLVAADGVNSAARTALAAHSRRPSTAARASTPGSPPRARSSSSPSCSWTRPHGDVLGARLPLRRHHQHVHRGDRPGYLAPGRT